MPDGLEEQKNERKVLAEMKRRRVTETGIVVSSVSVSNPSLPLFILYATAHPCDLIIEV